MWARIVEACLGAWLAASPWIFRHGADARALFVHDVAVGSLIAVLALSTYARALRRAHLLELVVALWLAGYGWWTARLEPTPASQNHLVLGLLIAMLAIVPSEASRPPAGWRAWNDGRRA